MVRKVVENWYIVTCLKHSYVLIVQRVLQLFGNISANMPLMSFRDGLCWDGTWGLREFFSWKPKSVIRSHHISSCSVSYSEAVKIPLKTLWKSSLCPVCCAKATSRCHGTSSEKISNNLWRAFWHLRRGMLRVKHVRHSLVKSPSRLSPFFLYRIISWHQYKCEIMKHSSTVVWTSTYTTLLHVNQLAGYWSSRGWGTI